MYLPMAQNNRNKKITGAGSAEPEPEMMGSIEMDLEEAVDIIPTTTRVEDVGMEDATTDTKEEKKG